MVTLFTSQTKLCSEYEEYNNGSHRFNITFIRFIHALSNFKIAAHNKLLQITVNVMFCCPFIKTIQNLTTVNLLTFSLPKAHVVPSIGGNRLEIILIGFPINVH